MYLPACQVRVTVGDSGLRCWLCVTSSEGALINSLVSWPSPGILFNDGQTWRELRRVTQMAMRDFGVGTKTLEQRVQEEARAVMEVMDKSEGRPVTLRPLLSKFSCNVICSVILGERLKLPSFLFRSGFAFVLRLNFCLSLSLSRLI